ncbi:MAG: OadG family transporter subunit [Candidatus Marinimicrobia bacterium]|nr:OadG family transporter subunit [Candidatus Neomarinimicrobiota bacterium]MDD5581667.1 OadG family transporter subunit [Candidatus Neomarinimicrobiota bacterium]
MFKYITYGFLLLYSRPLFSAVSEGERNLILKITIWGFLIVIVALFVVYLFVALVNAILKHFFEYRHKKKILAEQKGQSKDEMKIKEGKIPDETAMAIMMALYLVQRQSMEEERAKLTFERLVKPYSPWSSKIYGLRRPVVEIKRTGK